MNPIMSNVIKLAVKEEAAEGHRIPKEIQKELIRKKGSKSRRRQLRQKKDIEKVSERRRSRRQPQKVWRMSHARPLLKSNFTFQDFAAHFPSFVNPFLHLF